VSIAESTEGLNGGCILFAISFCEEKAELRGRDNTIIDRINDAVIKSGKVPILSHKSLNGQSNQDHNNADILFELIQEYLQGNEGKPSSQPAQLLSKFSAVEIGQDNQTLIVSNKLLIDEELLNNEYILPQGNLSLLEHRRVYSKLEDLAKLYKEKADNLADKIQVFLVAKVPDISPTNNDMGLRRRLYGVVAAAVDPQGSFQGLAALIVH